MAVDYNNDKPGDDPAYEYIFRRLDSGPAEKDGGVLEHGVSISLNSDELKNIADFFKRRLEIWKRS